MCGCSGLRIKVFQIQMHLSKISPGSLQILGGSGVQKDSSLVTFEDLSPQYDLDRPNLAQYCHIERVVVIYTPVCVFYVVNCMFPL